MVSEQPTRNVVKKLKKAGFVRINGQGSHSRWRHPSGVVITVPDGHRTISPGVVRIIDKTIDQATKGGQP
ncbi:YcfA-like protein [Mycobacteroides abscessus subsp. abscessus]|uniref:type II toxin-antitoxin system HicA family toxin n=1 Tax=Mycobacteroides abscessus TaxID=36809 RepID=UPI000927F568|nr:type II toxin-antitoxin system HicA family toxin [Mycobacteroides abscessus]SHU27187.1 YcfA-like protein [Mycobacteroides abscessus subsp. abscessus]